MHNDMLEPDLKWKTEFSRHDPKDISEAYRRKSKIHPLDHTLQLSQVENEEGLLVIESKENILKRSARINASPSHSESSCNSNTSSDFTGSSEQSSTSLND